MKEVLFLLFSLVSAQRFSHVNIPQEYPQVQSMRPSASSGNPRTVYIPQPQQPAMPSYPAPHTVEQVGEVDSLDLFPSAPQQPSYPDSQPSYPAPQPSYPGAITYPQQPDTAPEFGVVQPPVWTAGTPPPQRPYTESPYIPEAPESRPAPPQPPVETTTENAGYAINYCDKKEFPDETLAQYGLQRIEYFIWNTTCSQVFFQCSIGQTFLLKCPSPDQAFDRATVNCNFRNSVRVCPEYDHIMHCSISDQCSQDEFACCAHPQKCVSLTQRCDGHNDCSDGEDENNCPSCQRDEFACVKSGRCIAANLRCDNNPDDCGDGTNLDEVGCSRNTTCVGKFMCHQSFEGPSCIDYSLHCDGHRDCVNGEDEINCKQTEAKYLLCENQKEQVLRSQWCDGQPHCADGSDEKYCY